MAKFELVSKYAGQEDLLPKRQTAGAAGYDFVVAEDTIIPPYHTQWDKISYTGIMDYEAYQEDVLDLDKIGEIIKKADAKPTLVPTGVKCKLDPGTHLELSVRSSCPLKYWLILANSTGRIDEDYYNCEANEGHIMFQFINLSPYAIKLKKNDKIGQGIIVAYQTTEDDNAEGARTGGFGSTSQS